jgi:uncharacterized membrane protein YqjE
VSDWQWSSWKRRKANLIFQLLLMAGMTLLFTAFGLMSLLILILLGHRSGSTA